MRLPLTVKHFHSETYLRCYNLAIAVAEVISTTADAETLAASNNPGLIVRDGQLIQYPSVEAGFSDLVDVFVKIATLDGSAPQLRIDFDDFPELYFACISSPAYGLSLEELASGIQDWLGVKGHATLGEYFKYSPSDPRGLSPLAAIPQKMVKRSNPQPELLPTKSSTTSPAPQQASQSGSERQPDQTQATPQTQNNPPES